MFDFQFLQYLVFLKVFHTFRPPDFRIPTIFLAALRWCPQRPKGDYLQAANLLFHSRPRQGHYSREVQGDVMFRERNLSFLRGVFNAIFLYGFVVLVVVIVLVVVFVVVVAVAVVVVGVVVVEVLVAEKRSVGSGGRLPPIMLRRMTTWHFDFFRVGSGEHQCDFLRISSTGRQRVISTPSE